MSKVLPIFIKPKSELDTQILKSILFLLAHLTILLFRLSMGEGGSSGVAAIVNYDPSVTSPKIIAGET